ncbi:hypothetical protein [Thiolinea disciformis]|uniref:hypothetical protein n=1 Tax=Thiolinea disciformis TaxID=125614 RepID=UPI000380DADF|nr:hypothetical protein [Thiolinea disciformis]
MAETYQRGAAIRRGTAEALKAMKQLNLDQLWELNLLYQSARDRLVKRYVAMASDQQLRVQHLDSILGLIKEVMSSVGTDQRQIITQGITQAAGIGAGVLQHAQLPLIADGTQAVRAVWHLKQADGLQLSDRLWRLDLDATRILRDEISLALVQGDNALTAAREFAAAGLPVQGGLPHAASVEKLSTLTSSILLNREGNLLDNAQRVFRTEMARAQTLAYIDAMESMGEGSGLVGYRFRLGANHKRTDICDVHAGANLYGLGRGVYPAAVIRRLYPAHPNTTSYIQAVFEDELSPDDKQTDQNRVAWLLQQSAADQDAILGKQKGAWLREGKLTDAMLNTPMRVLEKRLDP